MTKKALTTARILSAATAILSVVAATLRVQLMQTYDAENGFYTNAPLHTALRISLLVIAAVFFAGRYIYIKEENFPSVLPAGKAIRYVSAFVGCVLGGFVLFTFAKAVLPVFDRLPGSEVVMAVFALIAMLYYFTIGKKGDFRALLCSASALVLLAMVFGLYFNAAFSYVNHSGILCFAAAIFLMLSFVAEANFALGKTAYGRYYAYAPTAVILSFALSIPDLLFAVTGGGAAITNVYYDILFLTFGIYHLTRLAALSFAPVKE